MPNIHHKSINFENQVKKTLIFNGRQPPATFLDQLKQQQKENAAKSRPRR